MFRSAAIGLAVAACLAATLPGCGSSETSRRTTTKVRLVLSAPASGARVGAGQISVTGTVAPWQATVLVAGRPVTVDDSGDFRATVGLNVGTNLIDVIAGAPHAQAAMSAIRVVRYALVSVPKVTGKSPSQGADQLTTAGFKVKTDRSSDPLDDLLPLSMSICSQSPKAGAKVAPGSTVTLHVSKICGL